jgi:CheY-like chemotaxis protein
MPVLGGMAAIRILRQMQANKEIQGHVPILACTANARDEQIQAMEAAGFDGTVSFPESASALQVN